MDQPEFFESATNPQGSSDTRGEKASEKSTSERPLLVSSSPSATPPAASGLEEKKAKKSKIVTPEVTIGAGSASGELKSHSVRILIEGEAARKLLQMESELKERLSKPDLGKIIAAEIVTWSDARWAQLIEENTDVDYFFAQIRDCQDKLKSLKLLKSLTESLKSFDLPQALTAGDLAQSQSQALESQASQP